MLCAWNSTAASHSWLKLMFTSLVQRHSRTTTVYNSVCIEHEIVESFFGNNYFALKMIWHWEESVSLHSYGDTMRKWISTTSTDTQMTPKSLSLALIKIMNWLIQCSFYLPTSFVDRWIYFYQQILREERDSPKTVLAGTDSLLSQNETWERMTVMMQGRYVWITK